MYHQESTETKKKKKSAGKKWEYSLRRLAMGKPLLKAWKVWLGWVVIFTAIALVAISNQHSIEAKEDKIQELEDTHRKLMLNLKDVNEVVLIDEPMERKVAKEEGFEEVKENDYYIINNKE